METADLVMLGGFVAVTSALLLALELGLRRVRRRRDWRESIRDDGRHGRLTL